MTIFKVFLIGQASKKDMKETTIFYCWYNMGSTEIICDLVHVHAVKIRKKALLCLRNRKLTMDLFS